MKALVIVALFATLTGCGQQLTEKRFVMGRIVYKVESKAEPLMKDVERILSYVRKKTGEKELLPEEEVNIMYRDADTIKKDHKITYKEAKRFHKSFRDTYEYFLGETNFGSREK